MRRMLNILPLCLALLAGSGCGRNSPVQGNTQAEQSDPRPRVVFESQSLPADFTDWKSPTALPSELPVNHEQGPLGSPDVDSKDFLATKASSKQGAVASETSPSAHDEAALASAWNDEPFSPPPAPNSGLKPSQVGMSDAKPLETEVGKRVSAPSESLKRRQAVLAQQLGIEELNDIRRQADEHTRKGVDLANRGALYSAQAEFHLALQVVADAFDQIYGGNHHAQCLANGMQAMKEAEDFAPDASQRSASSACSIARSHRTPLLTDQLDEEVSCLQARRSYYQYACDQFIEAVGNEPVASLALYGLAKLEPMLISGVRNPAPSYSAKSAALYQAALTVDANNFLSANELAVQYAHLGKWQDAHALLVKWAPQAGQPVMWNNLAVVSNRLQRPQEVQMAQAQAAASSAQFAERERQKGNLATSPGVIWVSPEQFSQQSVVWSAPPIAGGQPTPRAESAGALPAEKTASKSSQNQPTRMSKALNLFKNPLR